MDNVCTVVKAIDSASDIRTEIDGMIVTVPVCEKIPFGHKFALKTIKTGEPVIKYGQIIGLATKDIKIGQHVHVHNLESCRGRGDK